MIGHEEIEQPIVVQIAPERIAPGPRRIAVQTSGDGDICKLLCEQRTGEPKAEKDRGGQGKRPTADTPSDSVR